MVLSEPQPGFPWVQGVRFEFCLKEHLGGVSVTGWALLLQILPQLGCIVA